MAKTKSELTLRVITALVLLAVFGTALVLGGLVFTGLILLVTILMAIEFKAMHPKYILLLVPLCASVIWLRQYGVDIIIWVALVVMATDIGGYFVGKKYGQKKLAPSISPNKTLEGAAGGLVLALTISLFLQQPLSIALLLSLLAIGGDLLESKIKRIHDVKDSGNILPGHGGILDRLDGFLLAMPAAAILVYFGII